MNKSSLIVLCLLSQMLFAAEPTSLIPAKRDFPLNTKINPCDNFHDYVCSEAEAAFKLRDDRSRHTFSFNDSSERILDAKKNFFASIESQKKLTSRSLQIKDFYQACMNEPAGVKNETSHLKKMSEAMRAIKSVTDFEDFQIKALENGDESFLNFDAYSNQDDPKINDIYITTQLMNLPEYTYYDNAELMAEYKKLIINFFKLVDPAQTAEQLADRAQEMIDFEKAFVKIYPHPEVNRQRWSEKRQEKQSGFIAKYPALQLEKFLGKTPKQILISNPLPEALEYYNESLKPANLAVLKDFYLYSFGHSSLDDSNPAYFQQQFTFNAKFLGGPVVRPVREERCTKVAMYTFVKELDQLLMAKLFPNFPAEKFRTVAEKIRSSIITGMQNNTWLGPETKAKAILKIKTARLYLITPETPKEWDFVPVRKYSANNRFENSKRHNQVLLAKKMKSLKEGANLESWDMGPLTVNAYYDPSANKFVMPMGILQYPFFNADGDLIENLGAVGAVIGHELGHGVDDQGAKYDENGKLQQWMTMKDLKEFSQRGGRMIDQFNKAGHNGMLTLGENIGDLVGLTFAYQAAFPDGKAKPEEQRKLFIAYGRLWCGVARPKAEEQLLKTDPHALGRARINEQVKHQSAFAQAFSCKPGDKMTLPDSEKVKIW